MASPTEPADGIAPASRPADAGVPVAGPLPEPSLGGSPAKRSNKLRWTSIAGGIVGLACVAFVVKSLSGDWDRVGDDLVNADFLWLAVGLAFGALANTWLAVVWTDALVAVGDRRSRFRVGLWFYVGSIGKYLPGGVWTVLGRGELARREGVSRARSYASVVLSLTVLVLAGLLTVVVLVPFDLADQSKSAGPYLVLLLLPVGVAALHPRVFGRAVRIVAKVMGRPLEVDTPTWGRALLLVLLNVPFWLGLWASTWAVARAFVPHPSILRIGLASVLAWVVGVVAVPVPAGAGVREAVFVAASGLSPALGATVAVASRVVYLVVDVAGALISLPFLRRHPSEAEDADGEGFAGPMGADAAPTARGQARAGPGSERGAGEADPSGAPPK